MQLLFDMFSTLTSLELKLNVVKTEKFLMYGYNAGPPMAIPIYTVLPYCAIMQAIPMSKQGNCVNNAPEFLHGNWSSS